MTLIAQQVAEQDSDAGRFAFDVLTETLTVEHQNTRFMVNGVLRPGGFQNCRDAASI